MNLYAPFNDPANFDLELAATINRMRDAYGAKAFEAACDYLLADAEMTALLRKAWAA
jgi:hypothetical protein